MLAIPVASSVLYGLFFFAGCHHRSTYCDVREKKNPTYGTDMVIVGHTADIEKHSDARLSKGFA